MFGLVLPPLNLLCSATFSRIGLRNISWLVKHACRYMVSMHMAKFASVNFTDKLKAVKTTKVWRYTTLHVYGIQQRKLDLYSEWEIKQIKLSYRQNHTELIFFMGTFTCTVYRNIIIVTRTATGVVCMQSVPSTA